MPEDRTLEGGCLCGALRYRIEGAPRVVSHCHCNLCRRVSGAAFVTWLTVRKDLVAISGEPAWYASSTWGRRGFCRVCGTHVLAGSQHYERYWDITAGSLDEPDLVNPVRHVFAGDKVKWFDIADALPAHVEDARSALLERD
jgi:hypothetical protein